MGYSSCIFIISGPSGVGKNTLISKIINDPEINIVRNISTTTRAKRENEIDGVDYYFTTQHEFQKKIENHQLLEWTIYSKNYYGTTQESIEHVLGLAKNIILEIEVDGARQVIDSYGDKYPLRTIFLMPPSLTVLKQRLIERNLNQSEDIERRLEIAKNEIEHSHFYNHVIIMDDLEKEFYNLKAYILNEIKNINH
ncbi:MAG: guanylate kinase [Mycoplasmataceae bacterium]|nr:guanylate kinase [Mycoplasmataceae bacterium]